MKVHGGMEALRPGKGGGLRERRRRGELMPSELYPQGGVRVIQGAKVDAPFLPIVLIWVARVDGLPPLVMVRFPFFGLGSSIF